MRLFVFRTLNVDDRLAPTVPGVFPRVRLLLELHTPLRIRRARALFAYLARTRRDPSALTDGFYVRVGVALAGRLPEPKILRSFLSPSRAPSDLWTSASRTNGVTDGRGVVKPNYWSPKDHSQRCGATTVTPGKSELGRRRYDWTPAPTGLDVVVRGPRGPSGGRER